MRIDPDRLLFLVDRHRVAGPLASLLRARTSESPAWSASVLSALDARLEMAIGGFLDQMCTSVRAGSSLDAIGVRYAVLKGPALTRLYRDEIERDPGRPGHLAGKRKGRGSRRRHTAERRLAVELGVESWTPRGRRTYMRELKDLSLQRPGGFSRLELHWRPFHSPGTPFAEHAFERLVTRRAGGHEFSGLSDVDEVAYLLGHGSGHGWSRLKWLADIIRADAVLDDDDVAKSRELAFPLGHEDARALTERLLEQVLADSSTLARDRTVVAAPARRALQRSLVGTMQDLTRPGVFFSLPFRPALRYRAARLALSLSLEPPAGASRTGRTSRELLRLAGTAARRPVYALVRRLDASLVRQRDSLR